MLNKYVLYKNRYYNAKNKIKTQQEKLNDFKGKIKNLEEFKSKSTVELTQNEILYRKLDKKKMEIYDERADLVLKSFEWQKPKNDYEIINCST